MATPRPPYCDDMRCRRLARWAYPSISIRERGENWRPYRLCDAHSVELSTPGRVAL